MSNNPQEIPQQSSESDVQKDVEQIKDEEELFEKIILEKPELKGIPKETIHSIISTCIEIEKTRIFAGPLPPPDLLKEYEEIIPGSAERIINLAEKQTAHRMKIEEAIVTSEIKKTSRGQIFGFILAIVCILAAAFMTYVDHPVPASIFGLGGISTLVSIFVLGRKKEQEEPRTNLPEK